VGVFRGLEPLPIHESDRELGGQRQVPVDEQDRDRSQRAPRRGAAQPRLECRIAEDERRRQGNEPPLAERAGHRP